MASEIVRYKADNGQDIEVTEQDVRDLMAANGNAMENVTSQEVKMFLRLCQSQRLNPFTRDAYIVKYGNQPASVIAGKDAFVKRATRNKRYRGHEAGITVLRRFKKNDGVQTVIDRREGSMMLPGEELVGGWAKVYLEGYECPIFEEVALKEYTAPDKYGKNGWSRMPATMIRKVALCHALREAFPEDLGGLYGAEEMDQARSEEPQPPRQQEDLRKPLWAEVANLKAHALALGTSEEGIVSWMAANITNPDGSPKSTRYYTAEEIIKLRDFLALNIANHEQPADAEPEYEDAEYAEPALADNDIKF
ncbi:phage recombination protein Bet [uncultured Adlercreutzia sp.]|uniref:phage recombination protein Bet n=1 Tax=uncultured Adlercreutzia sp. TaxID=875803 RepID=UPI002586F806|nr:phage recombination protein Bet [uncultured Adlercreutzia sp.]